MENNEYRGLLQMMQQLNDNIFYHLRSSETRIMDNINNIIKTDKGPMYELLIDKLLIENRRLKKLLKKHNIEE